MKKVILLVCYCCIITHSAKRSYNYQSVLSELPEVITNRNAVIENGYDYERPNPLIFPYDMNTNIPNKIPFLAEDHLINIPKYSPQFKTPGNFFNRQILPSKSDLIISNSIPSYLPKLHNNDNQVLEVKILNMTCLDAGQNGFFKVTFHTNRALPFLPITEDSSAANCLKGSDNLFRVDLESQGMTHCGVRRCSNGSLCLKLRVATVKGLKLPEDSLVILSCKPSDPVASHIRSFSFLARTTQGRALGIVASGGSRGKFETQVSLLKKTSGSNDFAQTVASGSAVQLGEDLLLRVAVKDDGGWRYSRMGNVVMERISSGFGAATDRVTQNNTNTKNSLTLVDEYGCRIASVKTICPEQPRRINALVTEFPFRAFMFQESSTGDEMVLSVNIQGCVRAEDCYPANSCEEHAHYRVRNKRDAKYRGKDGENITDWQSFLSFRVVLPYQLETSNKIENIRLLNSFLNPINLVCVLGTFLVMLFAFIIVFKRCN